MNETSAFQMSEVIAGIAVFSLMVSVPLIMVFMVYKFSKRNDK